MRIDVFIQMRLISNSELIEHKSANGLVLEGTKNKRSVFLYLHILQVGL